MKTASRSSVAVSFGSRLRKRMTPSSRHARAGDDRQAEHQQRVREQRAEDRGLRDDDLAGGQREEDDEELGQVPERRLENARQRQGRNARPRPRSRRRSPRRARRATPPRAGRRRPGSASAKWRTPVTTQTARIAANIATCGRYGRTKPMRSYIASTVGALASRAFSAPWAAAAGARPRPRAAPRSAAGSARAARRRPRPTPP